MKYSNNELFGMGGKRLDDNINFSMRSEVYMDLSWLDSWRKEIKHMNSCKVGQPYLYPETLIRFLGLLYAKGFAYRELEGVLKGLSKRLGGFPVISFSQIRRRIQRLDLSFNKNLALQDFVGIDGSGFKVSNRGEWIRQKWKIKRGWVKVVVMGNKRGEVIDVVVGDECLDERKAALKLITKNKDLCETILLDGLHDTKKAYEVCSSLGKKIVVPARKNANSRGLSQRSVGIREQKKLGRQRWAEQKKYGLRWPCTEGIFSAVKRIFGEELKSVKNSCSYQETKLKFWAYQQLRNAETLI
ncbi:MAG: IS5 family transposase [Candidatus Woesearchaeota archaeon]